jgi:hypothetical protein
MKKILLLSAMLTLPLMVGCKKQLYEFVGSVPLENVYLVDKPTGSFTTEPFLITKQDVQDALDLPAHAAVDKVDLQNSTVKIEAMDGNVANLITLNGTVQIGNGTPTYLFSNVPIPVNQTINLSSLYSAGVLLFSNQINAFLQNNPNAQDITIQLWGSANGAIHVKITYQLKCDAVFNSCIDIPSFISSGKDCNL